MTRHLTTAAAIAALACALAASLSACATPDPDPDRLACEQAGGEYVGHVVAFMPVGKTLLPVYEYTCEGVTS